MKEEGEGESNFCANVSSGVHPSPFTLRSSKLWPVRKILGVSGREVKES